MERAMAEQAHAILNKIAYIKRQIDWLSKRDCVLCFGTVSDESDKIYADKRDNYQFKNALDGHHRMIIRELENEVQQLEQQIINL